MSVSARQAVAHLDARLKHRGAEDLAAEAAANSLLPELVRALKSAGATQVVLFGSLADGSFHYGSDVDIAVAGLAERALGRDRARVRRPSRGQDRLCEPRYHVSLVAESNRPQRPRSVSVTSIIYSARSRRSSNGR